MKLDAKTITAVTGLVAVLLGGLELRLKVGDIDSRLSRIERVVDIEKPRFASNDK